MKEIKTLIDEKLIQARVKEIAREIENKYKDEDIILVCILKGSVMFFTELAKNISNNVQLEFIEVSSYSGTESTGKIILKKDMGQDIEGKNVIIVEDIVDTGRTLKYLKELLEQRKPKKLETATLLNKQARRFVDVDVEYIGFEIEDKFVLGYGLDYDQNYRNLPYVGYIE